MKRKFIDYDFEGCDEVVYQSDTVAKVDTKRTKRTWPTLKLKPDTETGLFAGVDECGRGPIFSRVYTAAVLLSDDFVVPPDLKICDSKKMTQLQLERADEYIRQHALSFSIVWRDEQHIDTVGNISTVIKECWHQALSELEHGFEGILVDGKDFAPYKNIPHQCVIKGDNTYLPIACASIIAKVARDQYIRQLASDHPSLDDRYDISKNVGYPTPKHLAGLKEYGISQFHRRSYEPCVGKEVNVCNT